jgi:two-component sensor histidine kinase
MPRFRSIRREIVAQRSTAVKLAGLVLAVVIPTLLRWVVDRGAAGAPFVTFWPVVLLVTAFLGWRYGVACALASSAVVLALFVPARTGFAEPMDVLVILPFFVTGVATLILMGHLLRSTVIALDERVRQSDAFNEELQHRAKNALQMIRALASRASQATDPGEFYETLAGRLDALAKANELLRFGVRDSCELDELVKIALRPFPAAQISCSGPACRVVKEAVTPLTMAIHELGTNASKYGSLSSAEGRVTVSWAERQGRIGIEWVESGGPEVAPPRRFGVGTRLLKSYGALKKVDLNFDPQGVRCRIRIDAASA